MGSYIPGLKGYMIILYRIQIINTNRDRDLRTSNTLQPSESVKHYIIDMQGLSSLITNKHCQNFVEQSR